MRLAVALLLTAAPSMADTVPQGCFVRSYSADHLAAHPAQGVAALEVWIITLPQYSLTDVYFDLTAQMADQGQARRDGVAGQVMTGGGLCNPEGLVCANDGDGGWFTIEVADADGITIATSGMRLDGPDYDDGGASNAGAVSSLHEGTGLATRYRLARVADAICEGP